jgi:hypothetical protein
MSEVVRIFDNVVSYCVLFPATYCISHVHESMSATCECDSAVDQSLNAGNNLFIDVIRGQRKSCLCNA